MLLSLWQRLQKSFLVSHTKNMVLQENWPHYQLSLACAQAKYSQRPQKSMLCLSESGLSLHRQMWGWPGWDIHHPTGHQDYCWSTLQGQCPTSSFSFHIQPSWRCTGPLREQPSLSDCSLQGCERSCIPMLDPPNKLLFVWHTVSLCSP